MAHTLYTLGYSGHTPAQIKAHVERLGAALIDVRYMARSMQQHWRGAALRQLVGPRNYFHLRCLGNINYKNGGPIVLDNPNGAVWTVRWVLEERPAILLCGCAEHVGCHRTVAAEWLAERLGAEIVAGVAHLDSAAQLLQVA